MACDEAMLRALEWELRGARAEATAHDLREQARSAPVEQAEAQRAQAELLEATATMYAERAERARRDARRVREREREP
jgi:hypothetical protein